MLNTSILPSRKGDGVSAPILSIEIKTIKQTNYKILTYITINACNIRRHHELHVKACLAKGSSALLACKVMALWSILSILLLLLLLLFLRKHLLREHLGLVLLYGHCLAIGYTLTWELLSKMHVSRTTVFHGFYFVIIQIRVRAICLHVLPLASRLLSHHLIMNKLAFMGKLLLMQL